MNHKVLGRGRVVSAPWQARRAPVPTRQLATAELSRYVTNEANRSISGIDAR
jgi:hypothetical protein